MLFLGYAAYFGGLYVTNPNDNWETAYEYENNYITVSSNDNKKYEAFLKKAEDTGKLDIIQLAGMDGICWKSIMGFESGVCGFTFRNIGDFKKYCSYVGIDCDFSKLKSNTMVMSRKLALNKGYSIGDKLNHDKEETIISEKEFELVALTEENGYFSYFISDENSYNGVSLLMAKSKDIDELHNTVYKLNADNDVIIVIPLKMQIPNQFEMMNIIYIFTIILLSLIMAVTVNAAFVGTYQRRTFEFAIYRAIGISKKRVIGKLIGELLLMDAIALIGGGLIFFLFLYLFNNLVLYPNGLYLNYCHPISFIGLAISNLTVMLPLIFTRSRQMLKADICEF